MAEQVKIGRRCFICGSAAAAVGATVAGVGVLGQAVQTKRVSAIDDPNIVFENVEFKSGTDTIAGYLARPKAKGKYRAVVIVPGNWLVEPYIAESAAMYARAGFVGLAVDVFPFFPKVKDYDSITDAQWDASGELVRKEYSEARVSRIVDSGIDFLKTKDSVKQKRYGITGFCGGGWGALYAATQNKEITAAVPFYAPPNYQAKSDLPAGSRPTPLQFASQIKIPVQGHYGTKDSGIPIDDVKKLETILRAQKTEVEIHYYEAGHGFFAYNRTEAYQPAAASLAFKRATNFFNTHLK